MTGYDLWATHAAVPAAAHYDLVHSPIEHTVSALLDEMEPVVRHQKVMGIGNDPQA